MDQRSTAPFLLLLSAIAFTSCSNGPISTFDELGDEGNTRGFGREYPQDPNENAFTFGVGDSMVVNVDRSPEFSGGHTVRLDGRITVPIVGDVVAAGLTSEQLAKKLETLLAVYVRNPKITVAVESVRSKAFFVASQSTETGGASIAKLPYEGDTTLFDVFVEMGSPSTMLDDDEHVKVIRGDPRHPQVFTINVREIWMQGRTGGNIRIRPDDIVFVPATFLGKVNRLIAGISLPMESLFRVSRSLIDLDTSIKIVQGDDDFRRGRGY